MKLFFRQQGNGFPLIILHGLFGMSDNWMHVSKKLSDHFSVIMPDLRNHGRSPHSQEWNYSLMCGDVVELIQELQLKEVFLLGHSLGGKVAMSLSLQYPELVKKLIVADIAPKKYFVSKEHLLILYALSTIDLGILKSRKDADDQLSEFGFGENIKQFLLKSLYRETEDFKWRFNIDSLAQNIERTGDPVISGKNYPKETFFLRGEKSNYILESDAIEIRTLFPLAQIQTVEGAGHWIHADKPTEFVERVERFLTTKERNPARNNVSVL